MNVLFVTPVLASSAGGSAVSEASLAASLQKQCPTSVLCRKGALDPEFASSFGLTAVKEFALRDIFYAWRDTSHWLRRELETCDVVHLNGHWKVDIQLLAALCRFIQKPFLIQPRGMFWVGHRRKNFKKVFNWVLGYRTARSAARVIALSQFETRHCSPYQISRDKIAVIPNGIQPVTLPAVKHFSSDVPYFLYFGRLESRKNLFFLLRAFHRYHLDGGEARLKLVGPSEKNYAEALSRLIQSEGLAKKVEILPPVFGTTEKTALFQRALAVIYPTREEAFGRVPFETLAAGGVPIVPRQSGSAEYLMPLLPDCVYEESSEGALVAVMRAVEGRTIPYFDSKLDVARGWVASELSWPRITEVVLDLYHQVLLESYQTERPGLNRRLAISR
jgi:glycosyltransferase involved in cell wall biosynthesis